MGKTSNAAKQAWNSANYTQIKASIDPAVASAFKESCALAGVSMAKALTELMAGYSGIERKKEECGMQGTRPQRRKTVKRLLVLLEEIRQEEEAYMDRIPDNLRNGSRFEAAEQSIEALEGAMEILNQAY